MVGSVVGIAAGTAGASTNYTAKFKATSVATVVASGSGQPGGSLKIYTMKATGPSNVITLTATATVGTVTWTTASVTASGGHATLSSISGDTLNIKVTRTAGVVETINVTGITYKTTGVAGTVTVTATNTTTGGKIYVFHPATVVNAKGPAAPPVAAAKGALATTGSKTIGRGAGQVAGTLKVTLTSTATTATAATAEGWSPTTSVTLAVTPTGGQCTATTHFVLFTGTPKATVTAKTATTKTPTVSVTLMTAAPCSGVSRNEAKLVFTNTGFFTAKDKSITVTLSGIKYNVGAGTTAGTVTVTEVADSGIVTFTPTSKVNASVRTIFVTANTPAVTVSPTALDASISPIFIAEQTPGAVNSPYVCIKLSSGTFNTKSTGTVKVTKGNATVTSKVTYKDAGGAAPSGHSATFAIIHVKTTSSTTKTSTFEVSGLGVNSSSSSGTVTATITMGSNSTDCTADPASVGSAVAFTVGVVSTQIYGATSDATAAAALARAYPPHGYVTSGQVVDATTSYYHTCPGTAVYNNEYQRGNPITENRPVVLATTKTYADALSSQYLASFLNTGTLLTPTTSLSNATINALRVEGISHVYVVGGPLAITTTVVAQIETTPVYNCGGTTEWTKSGSPVYIQVTRIWGQTAEQTAAKIAEYVGGKTSVFSFPNAYTTTNKTGGTGIYNDTAGKGSAHPSTGAPIETAILASAKEFQDAEASSTLSYAMGMPLLLTTVSTLTSAAQTAIENLHVKQIILMGGQLAVTNTVVTQLEKLTVSVLRIAGQTYVDTAIQLAKFEMATSSGTGLYDTSSPVNHHYFYSYSGAGYRATVARGSGFTDGLAGAVIAANADTEYRYSDYTTSTGLYSFYNYTDTGYYVYAMPLLLTLNTSTVGATLLTFLASVGKTSTATVKIESLNFLGGPLSITPSEINQMEAAIG